MGCYKILIAFTEYTEPLSHQLGGDCSTVQNITDRLFHHAYCSDVDSGNLCLCCWSREANRHYAGSRLYSRALKIQQTVGNTNWILRAGALHIGFAGLHALGKTVDGSGIDTCAIESGTYTTAALRGIYGGKAYKRGVEYHVTNSLAIMMMKFDAIASANPAGPFHVQCTALKKALHERSSNMVEIFNETLCTRNISSHMRMKTRESSHSFSHCILNRWKAFCI